MPQIPPWIQAANPAEHTATGMRIGIALAAQEAEARQQQQAIALRQQQMAQEQAAQDAALRFKEAQMFKQDQQAALDRALQEQKYSLEASDAAKKYQAVQQYQSAISGGMDPNEAMMFYGPGMAQSTGTAAAIRAQERASRAPVSWKPVTLPGGIETVQSNTGQLRFPPRAGAVDEWTPDKVTTESGHLIEGQRNKRTSQFRPYAYYSSQLSAGNLSDVQSAKVRQLNNDIGEILKQSAYSEALLSGSEPALKSDRAKNEFAATKRKYEELLAQRRALLETPAAVAPGLPTHTPQMKAPTSSKSFRVGGYTVTPL